MRLVWSRKKGTEYGLSSRSSRQPPPSTMRCRRGGVGPQQASFTGRHYRHERCRALPHRTAAAQRRRWGLRLAFPFHSILMPDGCFSTPMVLFSTHIYTVLLARRNFKLQFSIIFSMQAGVVNGILRLAMAKASPAR